MSIRTPATNSGAAGNTGYRLILPASATAKAANLGYTTAVWIRTPNVAYDNGYTTTILAKDTGTTSGNGGTLAISQAGTQLTCQLYSTSTQVFSAAIAVELDRTYLVLVIVNPTSMHLVACEPGGTPVVATVAGTALYTLNMTTNVPWLGISGGSHATNRPWYGTIEEFCHWTGTFPETAGAPATSVVQALANGTTDLDTVHSAVLTGGARKCRYRLSTETDLADAWGGAALTEANVNRALGQVDYTGGPLRPVPLMPARTVDCVSQAVFGTPGDAATAIADIRIEGGGYSGLPALARVQARLLDESQTVVRDWTDLAATAPSGGAGTWAEGGVFSAVPMQASYLRVEFRALNGAGTVIAGPTPGHGLRGAGFHLLGTGQSQIAQLVTVGSALALTGGIRFGAVVQIGNDYIPASATGDPAVDAGPYVTRAYLLAAGSGTANSLGVRRGIRQMANEINAIYPGIPIQFSFVGQGGTALEWYSDYEAPGTPGRLAQRWENLKASFGPMQPFLLLFFGHSQSTGGDYGGKIARAVTWTQAKIGTPIRYLHAGVPRYKGAGTDETTGNALAVAQSRTGARDYCLANPAGNMWLGSWSMVFTTLTSGAETGGSDPHSEKSSDFGQGRTGTLLALGWLMGARAVADRPIGITRVRADAGDAVIEFGAVG